MKARGFTLIELLVVIAIIGLLSSVVLASLNTARAKARDANRIAAVQQLQRALELYYFDNGQYPLSGGASSPNASWSTSNDSSWTTLQTALAPYMSQLPRDPIQSASGWPASTGVYGISFYSLGSGGCNRQSYMIVFRTENVTVSPGATLCNGATYNYGNGTMTVGRRALAL